MPTARKAFGVEFWNFAERATWPIPKDLATKRLTPDPSDCQRDQKYVCNNKTECVHLIIETNINKNLAYYKLTLLKLICFKQNLSALSIYNSIKESKRM